MSRLDALPQELVLHIASFLDGYSILPLRLVSKHLSKIAADNELWKRLCLRNTHSETARRRLDFLSGGPIPVQDPAAVQLRALARSTSQSLQADGQTSTDSENIPVADGKVLEGLPKKKRKSIHPDEVNWYEEYVARNSPLSLSWLETPLEKDKHPKSSIIEARGLGCLGEHGEHIIAPFDDGSVCIWGIGRDTDQPDQRNGRVLARSRAGLLYGNKSQGQPLSQFSLNAYHASSSGVVECVSVDASRNKAYFSVEHGLNEVDLQTLQLTAHHKFPAPISVLSRADYPTPLTVGTTLSLQLHDPRVQGTSPSSPETYRLDSMAVLPSLISSPNNDLHRLLSGVSYATNRPRPLSIVHSPSSDAIHIAGRFPSILTYDRRTFPKIESTIHTNANLCSLALSSSPGTHDLVACGEYKSKGSLEIYRLSQSLKAQAPISNIINRTSASRSKLLSVASHGTRIIFSDGDGMLKWVEKDGTINVRRWNVNQFVEREMHSPRGVFGGVDQDEGNVVRKILPLHEGSRSELAIWTGEKIGIVGFGKKPRFGPLREEESSDDKDKKEREMEDLYGERMRMALERQGDEVRFTRYFGLGT